MADFDLGENISDTKVKQIKNFFINYTYIVFESLLNLFGCHFPLTSIIVRDFAWETAHFLNLSHIAGNEIYLSCVV